MAKAVKKSSKKAAKSTKKEEPAFDPVDHELVPKHEKLSAADAKVILEKYRATPGELPRIHVTDPAIRSLAVKQGDVVKITRKSPTAGEIVFYRGVIDE
jgi:DNA-directed RNA polymerase subunit H